MTEGILHTLGGLGLFLLGILVMTSGLRGLAGDFIRRTLTSFTHSPASGALTGALTTALVQSSSATTVTAVSFVAAGLLTFAQALGIIFGANLGTTITGWLVALVGFKLKIGVLALPIVFFGVLLRIFAKGRLSQTGYALAGFGLVFVGIGEMQAGMEGMEHLVTPDIFPADTWGGRLKLLAIGIGITIVTQSSSAGVATALTAVYAGAMSFNQAAAMIIGMDIGTTVTAVLASIGGSVEARRTGFSHAIYNLLTGIGALLLLTPYTLAWKTIDPQALTQQAELLLVGFHTLFNLIGVFLILPFAQQFARMVIWLIPDRSANLSRHLQASALSQPMVALEMVHATLKQCTAKLLRTAAGDCDTDTLTGLKTDIENTQDYVDRIHLRDPQKPEWHCLLANIHTIDHLTRLTARFEQVKDCVEINTWPEIEDGYSRFKQLLDSLPDAIDSGRLDAAADAATDVANRFEQRQEIVRTAIMEAVARGQIDTDEGDRRLDDARWLRRACYHLGRISQHLAIADQLLHQPATHLPTPQTIESRLKH